ncbi:MAG TPA: cbb3-type cytochrome c oxidase subunit I [Fibrobacteria bacterium]|nr:cbb3-type cytochrome c oxidase subunit I [Fibrobacteria bacterium]
MSAHHENINYLKASKGLLNWFVTVDHKRIGMMYLASILFFFMAGGTFAFLFRLELWSPLKEFLTPDQYNQFFTLHGVIMVFLVVVPGIPAVLGNFILPIQLGAKDLAFPKLNLTSLYLYWIGALTALWSIVAGRADQGWTMYAPYSLSQNPAVLWMMVAAFILGFSSILTGLNFIVTMHNMRAPGLTWYRLPLFVWAMYATGIMQIFATPVLAITLVLLLMENFLRIGIFDPALGGDPLLMQHFFWFYSHPAVYIIVVPGFGVTSELITAFTKKNIFGYRFIAYSSVAIAVIGFLVWGHHMFVSGQSELADTMFSFLTFFTAVPSAIKVFNWTTTLYKGSIELRTPMLYALQFIFNFTIGGLTGIILAILSVDIHLHDTYFIVSHFHYVAMGSTMIVFIGGIHYWWPKMTGKMYNEFWGRLASVLVFVGLNTTFFVQLIMGSHGSPRRYYHYLPEFQIHHQVSTIGVGILAVGLFMALINLLVSMWTGEKAPANPWGAKTLEWTHADSPPVLYNFKETPVVTHGPYAFDTEKA